MLTLYRRHRTTCKSTARRAKCSCPIWTQGVLHGGTIRKSLDLTNWEAANRIINEWEIHGEAQSLSVKDAGERWIADCEARKLKPSSLRKYREIKKELQEKWGASSVRSISVDDVRKLREGWKYSGSTTGKRLELVRSFFSFCVDSGWIDKNAAKGIKPARYVSAPTLPYSQDEWDRILWATDAYGEIHPQSPPSSRRQLKALILLMRYSGLRISDAISLTRDRVSDGTLFLYTQKTGKAVRLPLPKIVLKALVDCDEGNSHYFWSGAGTLKSRLTEWQSRLKKVSAIAGIEGRGFAHRCRASFSVELLNRGVPLEMVALILGNSPRIVEKHYSSFVQSRQLSLEAAVKGTWA
jgi:integrase/recombinase XerD